MKSQYLYEIPFIIECWILEQMKIRFKPILKLAKRWCHILHCRIFQINQTKYKYTVLNTGDADAMNLIKTGIVT